MPFIFLVWNLGRFQMQIAPVVVALLQLGVFQLKCMHPNENISWYWDPRSKLLCDGRLGAKYTLAFDSSMKDADNNLI